MSTPTDPAIPDLPELSPQDAALFQRLVQNGLDLPTLAGETGQRITDLLRWFFSPPIQRYINALQRAAEIAVELTAARTRPTALNALRHLAAAAEDPLERRRAAATLATHSRPPKHPRPPASADAPPAPAEHAGADAPTTAAAHESPPNVLHDARAPVPRKPGSQQHPLAAAAPPRPTELAA